MGPGDKEPNVGRVCVWVDKHHQHNVSGMKGHTGYSGSPEEEMTVAQLAQEGLPGGNHV